MIALHATFSSYNPDTHKVIPKGSIVCSDDQICMDPKNSTNCTISEDKLHWPSFALGATVLGLISIIICSYPLYSCGNNGVSNVAGSELEGGLSSVFDNHPDH